MMYHRLSSDKQWSGSDAKVRQHFPNGENINIANKSICDEVEIPDNFNCIKDYIELKHDSYREIQKVIDIIPNISKGLTEAKRYWSFETLDHEAKSIKANYPKEVEKIRTLLWKRHLILDAIRKFPIKNPDDKGYEEKFFKVAVTVCFVASAVFFLSIPCLFSGIPLILGFGLGCLGIKKITTL